MLFRYTSVEPKLAWPTISAVTAVLQSSGRRAWQSLVSLHMHTELTRSVLAGHMTHVVDTHSRCMPMALSKTCLIRIHDCALNEGAAICCHLWHAQWLWWPHAQLQHTLTPFPRQRNQSTILDMHQRLPISNRCNIAAICWEQQTQITTPWTHRLTAIHILAGCCCPALCVESH